MEPDPPPTRRFDDRAQDYAHYRPGYPRAVVDLLLSGWSVNDRTAADVGAGTGISARMLAEAGLEVIAVEPNADMQGVAVPHARVRWVDGTAEATGLPDASVDLVVAAQAFHWFDRERALAEFQRILRREGRLVILWNRRSRTDPFTLGYRQALAATAGEAPAERTEFAPAAVAASGRFTNLRTASFPNRQPMTVEELLGRARSTSTVPKSGPVRDELERLLRALHRQHADASGHATMHYHTQVFLWDRVSPA